MSAAPPSSKVIPETTVSASSSPPSGAFFFVSRAFTRWDVGCCCVARCVRAFSGPACCLRWGCCPRFLAGVLLSPWGLSYIYIIICKPQTKKCELYVSPSNQVILAPELTQAPQGEAEPSRTHKHLRAPQAKVGRVGCIETSASPTSQIAGVVFL